MSADTTQDSPAACLIFSSQDAKQEDNRQLDLVDTLQNLADESSHITFSTKVAEYGYVGRNISLKRSFRNILENGVTYGDQVHMIFAQSGNLLIITIQDQGPGIPEENLEEVFEPFVRLDKERNTESGSVGLGLSIARTIIHNHGGTIAATNTNPGLKVTITLPTV